VTLDDGSLEELLGAYAIDSCDPEETAAVEELLRRRPDLADEVARMTRAAAWLGALEATEPPGALRDAVLAATAGDPTEAARHLYEAEAARLDAELEALDAAHYDVVTPNGLSARSLAIHLAAQDSLFAQLVGHPVDEVDVLDIDDRTAAMLVRYGDRPLREVLDLWRAAVAQVLAWARGRPSSASPIRWLGLAMSPADVLTARSFEDWIHREDLRRVRAATSDPPPERELGLMAALAMRTLPAGLASTDHAQPGRSARIVLTGPGGGTWHLALDPSDEVSGEPEVTLTASALDWCWLAGERLEAAELVHTVEGDTDLAADLVAAAPAFATL
jgi:uncharacterized protein (TIGR03083 family)